MPTDVTSSSIEAAPAEPVVKERSKRGVGTVLMAALLAAVLSSGATALIMRDQSTGSTSDGSATIQQLNSGQSPVAMPTGGIDATPNWAAIAQAVRSTVVAIKVSGQYSGAEGSGVIVNAKEGHVVTNDHVVADAADILVVLSDGRIYHATTLGTDPLTDLAVLKITDPPDDLQEAKLGDSTKVTVGEPVLAVGNPLGYDNTVTTGIVSAVNRPLAAQPTGANQDYAVINLIQTDAAINPGNSGGPLFNTQGEVIGINSSIASLGSALGGMSGSIGLGFAIPSALVAFVAPQLIEKGAAVHAYLGVWLENAEVTYDGVTRQGTRITKITPGTAADEADLRVGDIIVGLDGRPITETASLQAWVRSYAAGQQVTMTLVRDGKALDVEVTLGTANVTRAQEAPAEPEPDVPQQFQEPQQQPFDDPQGGEEFNWMDPFGLFNW
ncbi:MAG: trypsin-like peptidase domain-containing protein [Micrococcales bacterium]|nr:trypsin-like peptidase domain-containing protein [Micrococcales bacterium]